MAAENKRGAFCEELRRDFAEPPLRFRVSPMTHAFADDLDAHMDAYRDYGYGGAVTNVPYGNDFTQNPENLARFREILAKLKEHGLSYWIYDDKGYPSGQGMGLVLDGHPEYRAKGFYMHRRIAYEPCHARYLLDDESDKIIWAAKYPVETPRLHDSFPVFERMTPVPFTADKVECDLVEKEILYVFCVKDAHEGSAATHNVSSFAHNINIMNKDAVARFIELCFEPVVKAVPDAYKNAVGVFTDEPSLFTDYSREYEVFSYALQPWNEGILEDFEKEYGYSLLPYLPLLFEGGPEGYPHRIRFYDLVGKLIAENYTGQLQKWCAAHGTAFSGHYYWEEDIYSHVHSYGNFFSVIKKAGFPGIDVLGCYPEVFTPNVPKYVQMAHRKNHTNGMMVEICPFCNTPFFDEAPLDNMTSLMAPLYLSGVRRTNSYFRSNYEGWQNGKLGITGGYMDIEESRFFNHYVGRLGLMLDGLMSRSGLFVYYAIENAQATIVPSYSARWSHAADFETDHRTHAIVDRLTEKGLDFLFADVEDLENAVKAASDGGTPLISGNRVETLIVPGIDVMNGKSLEALKALAQKGVSVLFAEKIPTYNSADGKELDIQGIAPVSADEAVDTAFRRADHTFTEIDGDAALLKGRFEKDGHVLHLLCNLARAPIDCRYNGKNDAELWSLSDGTTAPLAPGEPFTVHALRAVFVIE